MAATIEASSQQLSNPFALPAQNRTPTVNNTSPFNNDAPSTSRQANNHESVSSTTAAERPTLLRKAEGHIDKVTAVILLSTDDALLTVSEDRTIRVWQLRENGQYWPSICHYASSPCICADYCEQTRRLFVGLLQGTITEYEIAEDYNSLRERRNYYTHQNGVNCVQVSLTCEWILSGGKDRRIVWQCSETGRPVGSYACESSVLCLQFDAAARYAFCGDFSGHIYVLKVGGATAELVSKLSAHTGSVRALAWDTQRQWLFSGSFDGLIIVWDIGGKKGTAYELSGHGSKVTTLCYAQAARRLFTFDDAGRAMAWDMTQEREVTPAWASSDMCQRCDTPFFWNVKEMWQRKAMGMRQHHCRLCGAAVCAACSKQRQKHPRMGYELPVRICDTCARQRAQMQQDQPDKWERSQRAMAVPFDATGLGVVACNFNETTNRLATVGNDRIVKVWDAKPVLGIK